MYEGERPRKPSRVILMVLGFWVTGSLLQTLFGLVIHTTGLVPEGTEIWMGQILGWGLLFAVTYYYRDPIDTWLRRR